MTPIENVDKEENIIYRYLTSYQTLIEEKDGKQIEKEMCAVHSRGKRRGFRFSSVEISIENEKIFETEDPQDIMKLRHALEKVEQDLRFQNMIQIQEEKRE